MTILFSTFTRFSKPGFVLRCCGGFGEIANLLYGLQLDVCQQPATELIESSIWRANLLNGYVLGFDLQRVDQSYVLTPTPSETPVVVISCRICLPSYLSRHLICAQHIMELAAVLQEGR